jgi:hypothetical protein
VGFLQLCLEEFGDDTVISLFLAILQALNKRKAPGEYPQIITRKIGLETHSLILSHV